MRSRSVNRNAGEILLYVADYQGSRLTPLLGKKRPLKVRSWSTVGEIKGVLAKRLSVPPSSQRLFFKGNELLMNAHSLQDEGVCRSGEVLEWSLVSASARPPEMELCADTLLRKCPSALEHLWLQAKRALALGLAPSLATEGLGGSYFMPGPRGRPVCVFKPQDEEPMCENK